MLLKRTFESGRAGQELMVEMRGLRSGGWEQEQVLKARGGAAAKSGLWPRTILGSPDRDRARRAGWIEPARPSGVGLTMWPPEGNA